MTDEDLDVLRMVTGLHDKSPISEVWSSVAFAEDDRHRWIFLGAMLALHFQKMVAPRA